MYKDNEIGLEIYHNYNVILDLYKRKGTSSSKLLKLSELLEYFNNNYEHFNENEKKVVKNVIIIANDIINKSNSVYGKSREERINCINLINNLNNMQKEPIK